MPGQLPATRELGASGQAPPMARFRGACGSSDRKPAQAHRPLAAAIEHLGNWGVVDPLSLCGYQAVMGGFHVRRHSLSELALLKKRKLTVD